jgi:hypothetical protein
MTTKPWLRLRQICLVATDIEEPTALLHEIFGLHVCHIDPAVGKFGLQNRLMPIGNQLLEIVAPVTPGTAAERYLTRRSGDGGYMVITQCDNYRAWRARVDGLKVRVAHRLHYPDYDGMQLHPRDTGGALLEIDQQLDDDDADGNWHPAGPNWQRMRNTDTVEAIAAAELQSPDPMRLASRWSEIIGSPPVVSAHAITLALENAELRFVQADDGRGEGLAALHLKSNQAQAALRRAQNLGAIDDRGTIYICGTRFHLR